MIKNLYRHIAQWAGLFLLVALLISCAKESSVVDTPEVKQPTQPTQSVQAPIALSAYTAQPIATTRADKDFLAEGGIPNGTSIGVYAYYHPGTDSNGDGDIEDGAWSTSSKPDFMFNQQAKSEANKDGFSYSPLKYWPNTNHDKISFFGYYPYTNHEEPTSIASTGIRPKIAVSGKGLPYFEFTVKEKVDEQVDFLISDLLTNLPNKTSAVSPSSAENRSSLTIVDKVRLLFHHATSKVTIRIAVDDAIREDFMSMTISNLQLTNIYRKGTVTPSYASGTTTIDVTEDKTDPEHYQTTYTIVKADPDPEKTINHIKDCCLMLPQTLAYVENDAANTANLNITYSVTLRSHDTVYTYDNDGNPVATDHYTYSNTASLPLAEMKRTNNGPAITTWDPNHHYVYTIRLGAKRIEFTGQVVEWGQEVEWDNIVVDQIGGS